MSAAAVVAGAVLAWSGAHAQPRLAWKCARSEHFEVYSQAGEATARAAVLWFEQLRGFLIQQTGVKLDGTPAVRVIGFRSMKEYEPYRLRSTADAYCVSTESRQYVVLPALGAAEFGMAAHEYAHAVLYSGGYHLPAWLSEGLAEFFSTVRIGERSSTIGRDLPERSRELRSNAWISLPRLISGASESGMFYAESWALTEMLARSPAYAAKFPALFAKLAAGVQSAEALSAVYSRPIDTVARALEAWAAHRGAAPLALPGVTAAAAAQVFDVTPREARALIADLLMASGSLDRSEEEYHALAKEDPADANSFAALGTIALRRGDSAGARREWKRAIELGVNDAALCYRYSALASTAGVPDAEIRPVLERAVALKPDYDDAHYNLALLDKNAGHYDEALNHLRRIRNIAPARAWSYWCAMADALNELGRRDEAIAAAGKAREFAATAEERSHAAQLAYIAGTDLTVRLARDGDGHAHMVTTRIPHGGDWNPFIEAEDQVRRVSGSLQSIDCGGTVTRFLLETAAGMLALAIPDPSRLQVRNAPSEFTCGPQNGASVTAVYAAREVQGVEAAGVLRGIEFR